MADFARRKGIDILSISDWTHPLWLREIGMQVEEAGEGLYKLKAEKEPLFLLSTEIASIYSQGGRVRRIHSLLFAPSFEIAEKINKELVKRGANIMADGRPIIGLSAKQLLELALSIDKRVILIPAHAWTPHFGVYGSKSGFDSLTECFGDLAEYVYGIETGISSDPEMNWRVEELANRSILSFSDAHSPTNMAREVTAFELSEVSYENMRKAIMRKGGSTERISYTVEFYPEEGKYHFSGHRNCNISLSPKEILEKGSVCPVCKRELTEGVAIRIEDLAGADFAKGYVIKESTHGIKWHSDGTKHHPPYVKLVRLIQIISEAISSTVTNKKTEAIYNSLLSSLGSELNILLKIPLSDIVRISSLATSEQTGKKIADGVARVRAGNITVNPGFDGEYGKVKIWPASPDEPASQGGSEDEKGTEKKTQLGLF